jgi:DNA (cytosine-5)-methyltransferase 1
VTDYTALCVGNGQANQKAKGNCDLRADSETYPVQNSVVRRLTPLECERLQGYPDGWTGIGEWVDSNGKKHKDADSPRYKALGNSIALPFWQWMARRICAQYERPATMASLFDGIGGFPLVFSRAGAVPVWASEIEEFPIAVTKVRFPDESV